MGLPAPSGINFRHISFAGSDAVFRVSATAERPFTTISGDDRPHVAARHYAESVPLDPFLAWVLQRGGVQPESFRGAALNRRLPACLRFLRVPSTRAAQEVLQRRPELLPGTLTAVLIGVTQFFREPAVFENVQKLVLPRLAARGGALRVASFGVSRGQELYSAAMLLAESALLERSTLTGVDCRSDAIRAAAAGEFDPAEVAGLSAERVTRFFSQHEESFWVSPALKERMCWEVADLFAFKAGQPFELIFFRNVAIYLDAASAAQAWEIVRGHTAPGGYIVTGKAERPPPKLRLRRIAPSVYARDEI